MILLRFRGSGFRGNHSFDSDEKAEGGIDNQEDWVRYSWFSWGLEDIIRAGLLYAPIREYFGIY